jgi:hypothetical protein
MKISMATTGPEVLENDPNQSNEQIVNNKDFQAELTADAHEGSIGNQAHVDNKANVVRGQLQSAEESELPDARGTAQKPPNERSQFIIKKTILRALQRIFKEFLTPSGERKRLLDVGSQPGKVEFFRKIDELIRTEQVGDAVIAELLPFMRAAMEPTFIMKLVGTDDETQKFKDSLHNLSDNAFNFITEKVLNDKPVLTDTKVLTSLSMTLPEVDLLKQEHALRTEKRGGIPASNEQITEYQDFERRFKRFFNTSDPKQEEIYRDIIMALESTESGAHWLFRKEARNGSISMDPGDTVTDFIQKLLMASQSPSGGAVTMQNLVDAAGRPLEEMRRFARANYLKELQDVNTVGDRHFRGYRDIAKVLKDYMGDPATIYKQFIHWDPDANDGHGGYEIDPDKMQKAWDAGRQAVSALYQALQLNPSEGLELFRPLEEGTALINAARVFIDLGNKEAIEAYLKDEFAKAQRVSGHRGHEIEHAAHELAERFSNVGISVLTNNDIQKISAQINLVFESGNLEHAAKIMHQYDFHKLQDILTHSKYAAHGPGLWEMYLRQKINLNNFEVAEDILGRHIELDKKGLPVSLRIGEFTTRQGFIKFAEQYFKSMGLDPTEQDLWETYLIGNTFNAMTLRRASLFTHSNPYGDFRTFPDRAIVSAIDPRFLYTEKLGGLAIKGFWLRDFDIGMGTHMPMTGKAKIPVVGGLLRLWTEGHNPRELFQRGLMYNSKMLEYGAYVDVPESEDFRSMYIMDNTIKLDNTVSKVTVGDMFQWGWREKMFQAQYEFDKGKSLGDLQDWETNEDFIDWCRRRGGIVIEYTAAEDMAKAQADAYLRQVVGSDEVLRDAARRSNLELMASKSMTMKDYMRPYQAGNNELGSHEILQVKDKRTGKIMTITYNEYVHRLKNLARGRAWYHESLANPSQFITNFEYLFQQVVDGYMYISDPKSSDPKKKILVSAREFYLSDKYDEYDKGTPSDDDPQRGKKLNSLTLDDAKKRRAFRAAMKRNMFVGEEAKDGMDYMMDMYARLYDGFIAAEGQTPTDDEGRNKAISGVKKDARSMMYQRLAIAYGKARYRNNSEKDPAVRLEKQKDKTTKTTDGDLQILRTDILSQEEEQKLQDLETRSASLSNEEKAQLIELRKVRVIADLMFSSGNEQGMIDYFINMVGDTQEKEREFFGMSQINYNPKSRGSIPTLSSANFFERLGMAWSPNLGKMTAPTFDFDINAYANYGAKGGEVKIARHIENMVPLVELQETISRWYTKVVVAGNDPKDPFKPLWDDAGKIKSTITSIIDEGLAREVVTELMQAAIADMFENDFNRAVPIVSEVLKILNADWNFWDRDNPHNVDALSRMTRGPAAQILKPDDLEPMLEQLRLNGTITAEQKKRVLDRFNANMDMIVLWQLVPNGLFWATILTLYAVIKEGSEEAGVKVQ